MSDHVMRAIVREMVVMVMLPMIPEPMIELMKLKLAPPIELVCFFSTTPED